MQNGRQESRAFRETCGIVPIRASNSLQRVVAQLGSALDWGSRGRWFESSPPDQKPQVRRGNASDLFRYISVSR